ncbi:tumor protein p53-inducible protein 11-like isoform X3 [Haliotis rufescens]|uniref:tumor protein p53-inducible protein 11-like isoform X3 n=2 Tax=Haliotis rufescens TaxID=6454 RepID=UPI00201F620C|nr:tumor protein p53-inducible protein 11-like isoform X3 [Haliotis rufescens]
MQTLWKRVCNTVTGLMEETSDCSGPEERMESRRESKGEVDYLDPSTVGTYRKHSSGDLHSRLKTRKLLGVGETDDGDVHRSKLSQILGHSDQLYIRLPQGLRVWQCMLAAMFTIIALWALVFPAHLFDISFETEEGKYLTLPVRLYGAALLSLSLLHWNTLQSQDRDVIRGSLLSSVIYFSLQTIVTGLHLLWTGSLSRNASILLGCRAMFALITYLFYHLVGCKNVSIRRTNSTSKELHNQKEH